MKELNGVFFAPNYTEMKPFFIEAVKSFKYSLDVNPMSVIQRIITKYFEIYKTNELAKADNFGRMDGDFNLGLMLKEATIFCNKIDLANSFKSPYGHGLGQTEKHKLGYCGISQLYQPVTCTHENKDVFAVAVGAEVINTSDNDCYQTAGGYRTYKSSTTPIVYLSVSHYGIILHFESSLMVDHYNNNFAGVSTGNGTETYKEGEKLVARSIVTNLYSLTDVCKAYNLTLKKMDVERGKASLFDYVNL